jgi:hypothetical protein
VIISGGMLSTFGRFAPFMIVGGAAATVGARLIYTLDMGSPAS